MNTTQNNKNKTSEPSVLEVVLTNNKDITDTITLINDGVATRYTNGYDYFTRCILQTRAAFRGYVSAFCDLMDYSITEAGEPSTESEY